MLSGMAASVFLGLSTAMVYPALLAAVSDAAHPNWRASSLGVYRFWRDMGYVAGALMSGIVANVFGLMRAVDIARVLTLISGIVVWARMKETIKTTDAKRKFSRLSALLKFDLEGDHYLDNCQ
jgi:MFS family permease